MENLYSFTWNSEYVISLAAAFLPFALVLPKRKYGILMMIAGFIGCGPLMSKLYKKNVYVKRPTMVYVSILAYVVLFGFCIAAMVSSTFSSFLYFQF